MRLRLTSLTVFAAAQRDCAAWELIIVNKFVFYIQIINFNFVQLTNKVTLDMKFVIITVQPIIYKFDLLLFFFIL